MDSRPKIQSNRRNQFMDLWDSRMVPGGLNLGPECLVLLIMSVLLYTDCILFGFHREVVSSY